MPPHRLLPSALILLLLAPGCGDPKPVVIGGTTPGKQKAQQEKPKAGKSKTKRLQDVDPTPVEEQLTYPRDKDRVMATVDGRNITLDDIVLHIDATHFKGLADYLSTTVGQFEVRSPLMATWARQYADIVALRTEARKRDISETAIRTATRALLGDAVKQFEEEYEQRVRRKFPTTESSVAALHRDFLKRRGVGLEVEGLLNAMVPDNVDQNRADDHLKLHTEEVNGILTISHIYVRNRDAKTGALYGPKRMAAVKRKTAEIKRRLDAGAQFEEVAREMSEDRLTAKKGGRLENLLRIDSRMPASFCRVAWRLQDRKWTGPIQTRYGLHFVKRVKWIMRRTVLRLVAKNKEVRRMIRAYYKEDLLFEIRKTHHVTLKY
jgi:parvulin-like peptidyl-prolyl isomerase